MATTPWGPPQTKRVLAPGIVDYSTASHGGFHVSPDIRKTMPPELRFVETWAGPGWYEEDADWAIVALAFPHLFEPRVVAAAITTVAQYHASKIDLTKFYDTPAGQAVMERADLAREAA